MAEPKKLDETEHQLLVELQQRWHQLTKQYGELHYQKKAIEAELLLTDEALDQLDADRFEAVKKLEEKYGTGQIDLSSGVFMSDK